MKRLSMRKIRDVLRLSAEGLSTRQIAASLAIGRTTLRGYLDRATELGLSWPLAPEVSGYGPRTTATPPDWPHVHRELRRKGVTLSLLWEEHRASPSAFHKAFTPPPLRVLSAHKIYKLFAQAHFSYSGR